MATPTPVAPPRPRRWLPSATAMALTLSVALSACQIQQAPRNLCEDAPDAPACRGGGLLQQ
ncbi:MAG: hypothetical protein EBU75_06775 [Betaproteobacteria bacterium]|nr:hypothetical protein [Betaproteobacteria bacterium]